MTKKIFNEQEIIPILILSKIFSILIIRYNDNTESNIYITILNLVVSNIVFLIFIIIIFKLNKNKNLDIFSLISFKSTFINKANLYLLLLLSLFAFSIYFNSFMDFSTNTIYTKVDFLPLTILFFLIIGYTLYSGKKSLSKTSGIVLIIFILSLLLMFLLSIKDFNVSNVLNQELKLNISLKNIATNFIETFEFILLLYFLKYYKNSNKSYKVYFNFILISFVITLFIVILSTLAVGDFLKESQYPVYILSIVTNVSFLQRLDGIFIVVWVLVSFIKVTAIAFLISDIYDNIVKKEDKKFNIIKILLMFVFVIIVRFNLNMAMFIYAILFIYIIVLSIISMVLKERVNNEKT